MPSSTEPLDELYGDGATAQLLEVYRDPESLEQVEIEGGVRFEVRWGDGSRMKCDCYPEVVHIGWLESKTPGTYSWLAEDTPAVYKAFGVKRFTAAGNDAIRSRGDWHGDEILTWEL